MILTTNKETANYSFIFRYVTSDDSGAIVRCAISLFEGSISTKKEEVGVDGEVQDITRYRRTRRLGLKDLPSSIKGNATQEENGNCLLVFTQDDFGSIEEKDIGSFLIETIETAFPGNILYK